MAPSKDSFETKRAFRGQVVGPKGQTRTEAADPFLSSDTREEKTEEMHFGDEDLRFRGCRKPALMQQSGPFIYVTSLDG